MQYKAKMQELNLNENEISERTKTRIKKLEKLQKKLYVLNDKFQTLPEDEKEEKGKEIENLKLEIDLLDDDLANAIRLWGKNKDVYKQISVTREKNKEKKSDEDEVEAEYEEEYEDEEENEKSEQTEIQEAEVEEIAAQDQNESKIDALISNKNSRTKYQEKDLSKNEEYEEKNKKLTKPKKKNNNGNYAILGIGLLIFSFGMYNIWQNRK